MTDRNTHMTIREMCSAFDVTARTLRFYEAKELLFPIRQGTRRWFTSRDRTRLKLILRGKKYGLSLESIRQLLDLYDPKNQINQIKRAYEMGADRLAEMKRQRDELNTLIADLSGELDWAAEMLAGQPAAMAAAE